jgi:hypothetical protein
MTSQALLGLDEDFVLRARLVIPADHADILYSWLLNFQWWDDGHAVRYVCQNWRVQVSRLFLVPPWQPRELLPSGSPSV